MRSPRSPRGASMVAALLLGASACGAPEEAVTTSVLTLRTSDDRSCAPPGPVDQLRIEALGDFPSILVDQRIETVRELGGPTPIDRFPLETRAVTVTARSGAWEAAGAHWLADRDEHRQILLLPLGRSCAVADPAVRLLEGSAATALPDGGILIAGGRSAAGTPGAQLVRVPPPASGLATVLGDVLLQSRAGGTATVVGDVVVIAGGAADRLVEVYDLGAGSLSGDVGRLPEPRAAHGAIALDDARLLLVGGMDGDAVLGSAVLVDLAASEARRLGGELGAARAFPQLLRLDDGRLYVAGGRLAGGGVATLVEWLDLEEERFAGVTTTTGLLAVRAVEGAVAVALPGARIAWLGAGAAAQVLSLDAGPGAARLVDVPLDGAVPALEPGQAVALDDGTILIHAAGTAQVIDLGRGRVREVPAAGPRELLLPLADGSIAELGLAGASLRRPMLRTSWDNPPNTLLPSDEGWVALDAAPSWRGGTADAPEALAHVPTLRFSDFRVTPVIDGEADLLLRTGDGGDVRIVLRPEEADVLGCSLAHPAGAAVTIERRADRIELSTRDGATRTCTVDLPPLVTLSLRLYEASTLVALADIERL